MPPNGGHYEIKWFSAVDDAATLHRAAGLAAPASVGAVRVGVLDRANQRSWGAEALAFVRAAQAAWIHAHDVIVSPHGAQLSSLVFARPCTVVVEIFPTGFYLPGFYSMLAVNVGAVTASAPGNRSRCLAARARP
ncbi:hypothetical protein M885DRAFT_562677 [Pelagophyceae sp. CCMP2097]|nr:hypothetical protein M885DRAFT_562677 [Pelagophyceae sp. CCMP2097]